MLNLTKTLNILTKTRKSSMKLKDNERLDDLQFNNLYLIQNKDEYCFNSDSVKLANFVSAPKRAKVVDLCSGSGVIGILVNAKNDCAKVVCVELQEYYADMSRRSLEYNNIKNIEIVNSPVQGISSVIGKELYDVVVCNPPYKKANSSILCDKESVNIARHEIKITLRDVVAESAKLLKYGGKFFTVNKEERLTDLFCYMREYGIEPKVLKIIPSAKGANVILVEGKKGGKSGIKISL